MIFRQVHQQNLTRTITPFLTECLESVRAFAKDEENLRGVIGIPELTVELKRLENGRFDIEIKTELP